MKCCRSEHSPQGQQNKARIDTTRTSARSDNVSLRAHTDSSSQDVAAHLGAKARERERSSLLSSHSTALRRATPPLARANHASAQSIFDRPPPIPPPLPKSSALPWYLVYAPEVTSAKLDPRENVETKQDLDYISEGSQGRTSGSRATPTSVSGVSRTPSKSRMRMVPAGQRDRSRSRKLTVDLAGEDSGDSRSGGKRASKSFEDDATDSSSEASSCSSSESDSDHEETDGTDSESDELLEFKKATRRLAEVRYPDGGASSGTLLTIPSKKRKLLLEETLPGTYGSRQPSSISMIALDGLKSGIGPRAVARKSFARAIGSKLLAKKRQGSKE